MKSIMFIVFVLFWPFRPTGETAHDQFGDSLLHNATIRLGRTGFHHPGGIISLAYSPDSKAIASGGADGTIRLWDAATGSLLRKLVGHRDLITSVIYSSDGKILASGSNDGTARIWNSATGSLLHSIEVGTEPVLSVALTIDGQTLATSVDLFNGVQFWDVATGRFLRQFDVIGPSHLIVSPDGRTLIGGGPSPHVVAKDQATGKTLFHISPLAEDESGGLHGLILSPDATKLAAVVARSWIFVWDAATGSQLHKLDAAPSRDGYIDTIAFAADSKSVASADLDETIRIWDVVTGLCRRSARTERNASVLLYSPDGQTLASACGSAIRLRDPATAVERPQFADFPAEVDALVATPDGRELVCVGDGRVARYADLQTGRFRRMPDSGAGSWSDVAASPDGRTIALTSYDLVSIRDTSTGRELRSIALPNDDSDDGFDLSAFSPDGRTLATVQSRRVRLWETATAKPIRNLAQGYSGLFQAIAFAPDGRVVSAAQYHGPVRIFAIDGRELHRLEHLQGDANALAYSPDGRWLVSAGTDGDLYLWDPATGARHHRLLGHDGPVNALAFSGDGSLIASAGEDGTTRVWEVARNRERHRFAGHDGAVRCVRFLADGRLASGGDDGTILIWDVGEGRGSSLPPNRDLR